MHAFHLREFPFFFFPPFVTFATEKNRGAVRENGKREEKKEREKKEEREKMDRYTHENENDTKYE